MTGPEAQGLRTRLQRQTPSSMRMHILESRSAASSHRISQVGVEYWPVLCQAYGVRTDSPRCRRRRRSATLYLIMSA